MADRSPCPSLSLCVTPPRRKSDIFRLELQWDANLLGRLQAPQLYAVSSRFIGEIRPDELRVSGEGSPRLARWSLSHGCPSWDGKARNPPAAGRRASARPRWDRQPRPPPSPAPDAADRRRPTARPSA